MFTFKNSISFKFSCTIIAGICILMASIGFISYHFQKSQATEGLKNTIKQTADRLANNIVYPLWNIERMEIDNTIALEMVDKNINAVVLNANIMMVEISIGKYRDVSGQLLSIDGRDVNDKLPHKAFLTLDQEIIKGGMTLGSIKVIGTDRYLKENLSNLILQISLLTALTGILVSFLSIICMRTMVTKPIKALEDATIKIKKGDLNALSGYSSGDEIGRVTLSFNKMAQQLERNFKEIKMAHEALQKSQETFSGFFNQGNIGMAISSVGKGWSNVNIKLCNMLGYCEDELTAMTWTQITYPEDLEKSLSQFEKMASGEIENYEMEKRYIKKNGKIIYTYVTVSCIRNEDGSVEKALSTILDITKQKQVEKMRLAKEKAESANKAKSEFLANMSHEIRTPMNAVLGFSEVLEGMETDPEKSHYLDNIRTSGKALLNIINQVLDFSKIEAGKMELQYSAVSVETLFKEMNTIFGQKMAVKGLVFEIECESSVPKVLILDEVRLRQVLINLVGNAIKFTDTGKICLRATAVESDSQTTSRVELTIEVEDTGIGVPDSQKDKIFGAFEQIDGQKTIKYGGTGLGLAITHRLVTMMQGEIGVEGEEGHGAIFRFKLPNVEIAALKTLNVEADNTLDVQTVCFEPATILIIDDVDYNREMLTVYLATFNFSFLYAENGQEGIEQARKHHPDMILLDMKMPVMNGYEATRRLKADETLKTIPVIAVTASALLQDESTIAELCDGYLRKPVSRVEMVRELMRYLPHEAGKAEAEIEEKIVKGPMVIPPGPELKKLYHHAMVGDMDELSQFAQTLIVKDESLYPFVRRLQQLAAKFQDSDILGLLDKSMKDTG